MGGQGTFTRLIIGVLCLASGCRAEPDAAGHDVGESYVFQVEHSLAEAGGFVPRGEMVVKVQGGATEMSLAGGNAIGAESRGALKELLSGNGFYRLRMRSASGAQDAAGAPWVMASIPACDLHRAGYRDSITVTFDPAMRVIAIGYSAVVPYFAPPCSAAAIPDGEVALQTSVAKEDVYSAPALPVQMEAAAVPPGMENVKGIKKPGAEEKDGRSFLQRYWYIIAIAIFMMMPGAEDQPQQGQQAGAAGSAAGAAGAGASAAAGARGRAGGNPARRRRE